MTQLTTTLDVNMNRIVGKDDILFITFDTLRYDVATEEWLSGGTPNLRKMMPENWEKRHAPGNFTWASHHAFFGGFLPTPVVPGPHERYFAAAFPGSETTGTNTYSFEAADIVTGLKKLGYHTACIGGVGFFNKKTPMTSVFPDLFTESHWEESTGVTDPDSTKNQIDIAVEIIRNQSEKRKGQPLFLFLNIAAIHQPNYMYAKGETKDSKKTHAAALRYVDSQLPKLFDALSMRGNPFCILCSDHGTTYGEDGYRGHRLCHEQVWTVPFAAFSLKNTFPINKPNHEN
ncbi:STM4013/SEN3800 family hydrolase [Desulfogranum japonicum]|uniref:STM4013/SEN3800 family hydrolase n=1 Tax=Desulfogranum japonicum TaxID=231447 RepID=UPI000416EA82|nr:STM4013/SEN3800 family hydrolase [Desulfogranum japonicum]